ncbi:uncharacterized protein N7506_005764 [Penicillium brevicompactum]|uniref:uncharacterized protein n=1 Tax=Penicillium brevicompactum TaxID=5074 RepID=UPI002541C94B|nr:uncharacterized protein N7506_005764 [Penicillium brevicompactum]KAJ5335828.1 hypothetical protein N7506_005764 [Penicillium brevicompactum]
MGSGHRNTHIPDCGTRTVSYAILFPTVNSSQLSMEQNIQYTQSDSKRHIDYRGYNAIAYHPDSEILVPKSNSTKSHRSDYLIPLPAPNLLPQRAFEISIYSVQVSHANHGGQNFTQ